MKNLNSAKKKKFVGNFLLTAFLLIFAFVSYKLLLSFSPSNMPWLLVLNGLIIVLSFLTLMQATREREPIDNYLCEKLEKICIDLLCVASFTFSLHNIITISIAFLNKKLIFIDFGLKNIMAFAGVMLPCIFFLWIISLIGQSANLLITIDRNNILKSKPANNFSSKTKAGTQPGNVNSGNLVTPLTNATP